MIEFICTQILEKQQQNLLLIFLSKNRSIQHIAFFKRGWSTIFCLHRLRQGLLKGWTEHYKSVNTELRGIWNVQKLPSMQYCFSDLAQIFNVPCVKHTNHSFLEKKVIVYIQRPSRPPNNNTLLHSYILDILFFIQIFIP